MELMFMVLGIAMVYTWVHSTVIVAKKTKGTTSYESAVMVFALVTLLLYIMGTM